FGQMANEPMERVPVEDQSAWFRTDGVNVLLEQRGERDPLGRRHCGVRTGDALHPPVRASMEKIPDTDLGATLEVFLEPAPVGPEAVPSGPVDVEQPEPMLSQLATLLAGDAFQRQVRSIQPVATGILPVRPQQLLPWVSIG